ncbi:MAG: hypothetical protein M3014_09375, partial [Chloroflexota bacterium]|nr:hypothetical protein [Chloroflexota bacterium]
MMSNQPDQESRRGLYEDERARLLRLLGGMQYRFRWVDGIALLPVGLACGLGLAVIGGVAWRFSPEISLPTLLVLCFGLVVLASLAVLLYVLLKPGDLPSSARRADSLLGLDDRLSTALEADAMPYDLLRQAQLSDAVEHGGTISLKRDLPLRVDRKRLAPVLPLLALFICVLLVPDVWVNPGRVTRAQIRQEAQKIDATGRSLDPKATGSGNPSLQGMSKELTKLADDLGKQDTSEGALARISESESRLQQGLDPQDAARREALDRLANGLASSPDSSLKKAGEALKSGDVQGVQRALAEANDRASSMSPGQRSDMA